MQALADREGDRRRGQDEPGAGTWATTTVAALASMSRPIVRAPRCRSALAYGATTKASTPHPTAIRPTFVTVSRMNVRSRTTDR
jgi:hypothetical protein